VTFFNLFVTARPGVNFARVEPCSAAVLHPHELWSLYSSRLAPLWYLSAAFKAICPSTAVRAFPSLQRSHLFQRRVCKLWQSLVDETHPLPAIARAKSVELCSEISVNIPSSNIRGCFSTLGALFYHSEV
jgi:hypothetical protein